MNRWQFASDGGCCNVHLKRRFYSCQVLLMLKPVSGKEERVLDQIDLLTSKRLREDKAH